MPHNVADPAGAAREELAALVRDTVRAILPTVPAASVTGDKHLKELGADSVDRVEIILTLIERLGIAEPMARFAELPDIDALVDFLAGAERR
ncbi:phosphopantetheine-binding protein [Streptomyces specialis]|uniref:phosphopantetheine-binding protein n=1 Tax=Streptomyces specialis TaxID=498367 RepID=UPI00073EBBDD|nr:phosphopantetheine-binding protein [Streptomyces specialis]